MSEPRRVGDVPAFQRLLERGEFTTAWHDDGSRRYSPTRRVRGRDVPAVHVGARLKPLEACTREDLLAAVALERRMADWSRGQAAEHDGNADLLESIVREFDSPASPRLTVLRGGAEAAA